MINRYNLIRKSAALVAMGSVVLGVAAAESLEERVDRLERLLNAERARNEILFAAAENRVDELESQLSNKASSSAPKDAIARWESRVENLEAQLAGEKSSALLEAASSRWFENTTIGGYGEFTFGIDRSGDDEADSQRFVLYVGHDFTDRLRFVSELEIEHAFIDGGGDSPGAVELEQAFVEYDIRHDFQVRAGLFLIPVGLINESHEPPTFFGVERPRVEGDIIPTTWRENGIGVTKKFQNGLVFDGTFSTGLDLDEGGGDIRSSRTNGAQADADSAAITGRIAYNGIEGLRLTAFGQYNTNISRNQNLDGTLYGATVQYNRGGFGLRALFAKWDIDGVVDDSAFGGSLDGEVDAIDEQFGWYVEPSYTWELNENAKVGIFARYSESEFFESDIGNKEEVLTIGVNFWPVDDVVFKADYQVADEEGDDNAEQINLGFGYQF